MKTNTGIKAEQLELVAHTLNSFLADAFMLYAKTRSAHWNIEGNDFYSKHIFFEKQYKQLEEEIDNIAERIRILGHYTPGTLQEFLKLTHITEQSREKNDSTGFINSLLRDHESMIIHLRENINRFANEWRDSGTSDFITGIMEDHEKMAWMLRAHLI